MYANTGDKIKLKSKNKYEVGSEINVKLINFKTGRRNKKKTKCYVISCDESTSAYIEGASYELHLEVLENDDDI